MAISGTTSFNLAIDDIINEAFAQIGGEAILGEDVIEARRSLDLLLREWQNRGFALWKTDLGTFTASTSDASETLPTNLIDVIMATVRKGTTDMELQRLTMSDYERLPTKDTTGRPVQYAIQHGTSAQTMYLWPLADAADTYTIRYRYFGYTDDNSKSTYNADVPTRMLPALTAGLAYKMSLKRPGTDLNRIQMLKGIYDEIFLVAHDADRQRASFFARPSFRL